MELKHRDGEIEGLDDITVKEFFEYIIRRYKRLKKPIILTHDLNGKQLMRLILDYGDGCTKGRAKFYGSFNYDNIEEE